jgi:hypothetical protein
MFVVRGVQPDSKRDLGWIGDVDVAEIACGSSFDDEHVAGPQPLELTCDLESGETGADDEHTAPLGC